MLRALVVTVTASLLIAASSTDPLAPYVFVAGVEGTGHHWFSSFFRHCHRPGKKAGECKKSDVGILERQWVLAQIKKKPDAARFAVRAAAAPLSATPKAIKLVDAPSLHTIACQLHTVTICLPFIAHSDHAIDVDVSAILSYVGAAQRDGPVHDVLQRVWQDAAWGLLTAIRFQGTEQQYSTLQQQPQPSDPNASPIPATA